MKKYIVILSFFMALVSCKHENKTPSTHKKTVPTRVKPKSFGYHFEKTKSFLATTSDSSKIWIVLAVNRTDRANIVKMDSIIVPKDLSGDMAYYLPFPFEVDALSDVKKIILFSYATQTFAAYEYGELIRTGPTNMGRRADKTPTGLFFCNWKAEKTTSTFNDEWDLRWNFNIANKLGVGFHQYELPGYPASHSCLRLQERDAKYLYDWADQWILVNDQTVKFNGTPVVVFGSYDFDAPKPWSQLAKKPKALNLSESDIEREVKPFLPKILAEQQKRESAGK
ncbi:L,D-transpeptidase [Flavobacterium wongokense]|uniref:L,D-transpeptidase n=1 Tax=Flavobacterium wongokense TaxID=2910674 RepID=UPI001F29FFB3|nr:L,D-transpeptidase [Flavobacterium sp. WG47]MCF6133202.1 L,D-transpeptidase [Flavobacterium sp. WG47]